MGLGVVSVVAVPVIWITAFARRRRSRALTSHDTTSPASIVTTGQRR